MSAMEKKTPEEDDLSQLNQSRRLKESLFTKSIKQQENRHQCLVCGVVGCVTHPRPKPKRTPISKTALRVNRIAREIATRNAGASGRSASAGQYGVEIKRILDQFDTAKWYRKSSMARASIAQGLQDIVDKFEKLNRSNQAKELISRARFKISQWKDG